MYIPTICYVLIMYSYLRKQYTHSALKSGKEFNFRKISWKNHLHLHFFLNFWAIWRTTSELRGFCSNKSSSETLQKLQKKFFFWIRKRTQWIEIQSCSKRKTKKNTYLCFLFQKYGKCWKISLELFVEYKLWNFDEWTLKISSIDYPSTQKEWLKTVLLYVDHIMLSFQETRTSMKGRKNL